MTMPATDRVERLLEYVALRYQCKDCGRAYRSASAHVGKGELRDLRFDVDATRYHRCDQSVAPVRDIEALVRGLVEANGDRNPCRGRSCDTVLFWIKTPAGKKQCFELDGEVHWARCPDARNFQRRRGHEARGAAARRRNPRR